MAASILKKFWLHPQDLHFQQYVVDNDMTPHLMANCHIIDTVFFPSLALTPDNKYMFGITVRIFNRLISPPQKP